MTAAEPESKGASPAAAGPAGALLEAQVAAFYLLAMLSGTEPRGLPGAMIDRIKFQRGDEGHPMDDLIIEAHGSDGQAQGLDIQTKRAITFAPGDAVFEKVATQIAKSLTTGAHGDERTFAIATSQISRKISGAYQDVLTWARTIGSAETFHARLNRKGAAGADMPQFVATLRKHLAAFGAPSDDESVWRVLKRLRILVFDFTTEDSANLALANHQCAQALLAADAFRSSALWSALVEIALSFDAVGGELDRATLTKALTDKGFRLAGDRRAGSARRALAEASSLAIEAIDDTIGGAVLLRGERLQSVHAALDSGRYLEIRGAGGVGKSGLLKHLAKSIEGESALIALRPTRIIPRGWTSMRNELGYEGSARDLLSEIAASGGGLVLIDNAEGFTVEEQATVIDMIRQAAAVPGISVVVTARLDFGADDQNWLPAEALDSLGRAPVVTVDELSEGEVDDLRAAAPTLADLLSDHHPARAVVRNLFRLKRLARLESDLAIHTELELARRWWTLADGVDEGRRERVRILHSIAVQALSRAARYDVSAHPSDAVDALIRSETLIELTPDRVAFRHDVLRDWAVFNALEDDPTRVTSLPLSDAAPSDLVRGFELYSRHLVAKADDGSAWRSLLDQLMAGEAHGSWRRTAMLGIVRADDADDLITKILPHLLADDAALLREIIRTVMAVEVQPAHTLYAALGLDTSALPPGMTAPHGRAWSVLTQMIAAIGDHLPAAAVPSVVDLYTQWLAITAGHMPGSASLVRQIYHWLVALQGSKKAPALDDAPDKFKSLSGVARSAVIDAARLAFVAFAVTTPDLAQAYIADLKAGRKSAEAATNVLMFAGSLPQAAPEEYADLVAYLLIEPLKKKRDRRDEWDEPFSFVDHRFMPESPAQGPFLTLLNVAPTVGLALIRRLVDHEIAYDIATGRPADEFFEIGMADERRRVRAPWAYNYSRRQARGHAVGSALMALEAWGHDRVEAGDDIAALIDLILEGPDLSAPFVLVAVDLILSHWNEASAPKALDLVASPELLVLDRGRAGRESFSQIGFDFFGFGDLHKEPGRGRHTAAALSERLSRRWCLERTLVDFIQHGPSKARLAAHYALEVGRLGPPSDYGAFGDPSFMARYVTNLLNPKNWVSHTGPEGGLVYQSPPEEAALLTRLRAQSVTDDFELRLKLTAAAVSTEPADSALVQAAIARLELPKDELPSAALDQDRQIRAQAAVVIARDADDATWTEHSDSLKIELLGEVERSGDHFGGGMSQLKYNPPGLALVGLAHVFRRTPEPQNAEAILRVASSGGMAAAQGFRTAAAILAAIEPRLVAAALRCAMTGGHAVYRRYDDDQNQERLQESSAKDRAAAVIREMAWLYEDATEPVWPDASVRRPRGRTRGFVIGSGSADFIAPSDSDLPDEDPDHFFNHQAAASWLRGALSSSSGEWERDFVDAYASWTFAANGLGLAANADPDVQLSEWNSQFVDVAIRAAAGRDPQDLIDRILTPFSKLPDRAIHDLGTDLLKSLDHAYFAERAIPEEAAVPIRAFIADAIMGTHGWKRLSGDFSMSIEHGLGPAAAALFFCDHLVFGKGPSAYVQELGIKRIGPFLPQVTSQIQSAPSFFAALCFLNLAEVSPSSLFFAPAIIAAETWIEKFPDNTVFWVDQRIGARLCKVLDRSIFTDSGMAAITASSRQRLEKSLTALVALGVREAYALEIKLLA